MKYGIIADMHSNIHAYKEALRLFSNRVGCIICLGDIVGYNANPRECINLTKSRKKIKYVVKGNHDYLAHTGLRFSEAMSLHKDAYYGLTHTIERINEKDEEWLYNLPNHIVVEDKNMPFLAIHGAPIIGDRYGYILSKFVAAQAASDLYKHCNLNLCFFGHTHVPTFASANIGEINEASFLDNAEFWMGEAVIEDFESQKYDISNPEKIYLINPGTIGQPRGCGMHSFAIFDSDEKTVSFECFDYQREKAIQAIYDAGYSDEVALRLQGESEE